MLSSILAEYGYSFNDCVVETFGTGLINHTWKVTNGGNDYILQRINHNIFKQPEKIAHNIQVMGDYLTKNYPEYLFVVPINTLDGRNMIISKEHGYFRLMPFVKGSVTHTVVTDEKISLEAAGQFAKFSCLLAGVPASQIEITLPDFHNLTLRYKQFEDALANGNKDRINEAKESIATLKNYKDIVDQYEIIKQNPEFKLRTMHHDTKISNILFDESGKGLCVIDLDTVMPGYFISDVGDMMRTYLSPANEEESDFSKVSVRSEQFKAIVKGYVGEMQNELSETEKKHFVYAGMFMIYMQALRFLTDYINNDVYYGCKYEKHNFVRANNQIVLLERLVEKQEEFEKYVLGQLVVGS